MTHVSTFEELPAKIQENLTAQGITLPTPIQAKCITPALEGSDILAQSQTGSGKTLAFALPLIAKLSQDPKTSGPRAIILTPTRELATQISDVFYKTTKGLDLRSAVIIGGAGYNRQKESLRKGADAVIGTPGRIVDLIEQGALKLDDIQYFVLDEVDEMLDFGFSEALEIIRKALKKDVQTLFFSATLHPRIRKLAVSFLNSPVEIKVNPSQAQTANISHGFVEVKHGSAIKALINCLMYYDPSQSLIFCETRAECNDVYDALTNRGFNVGVLNSDMSHPERSSTMRKFKERTLRYLVATNVAARGIDIQDLPLVINMGVPYNFENYVHRVGRTGRAGAEGKAWTLVQPGKKFLYQDITHQLKVVPVKIELPGPEKIYQKCLSSEVEKLMNGSASGNKSLEEATLNAIASFSEDDLRKALSNALKSSLKKLSLYETGEILHVQKPHESRSFKGKGRGHGEGRGGRGGRDSRDGSGSDKHPWKMNGKKKPWRGSKK